MKNEVELGRRAGHRYQISVTHILACDSQGDVNNER